MILASGVLWKIILEFLFILIARGLCPQAAANEAADKFGVCAQEILRRAGL